MSPTSVIAVLLSGASSAANLTGILRNAFIYLDLRQLCINFYWQTSREFNCRVNASASACHAFPVLF